MRASTLRTDDSLKADDALSIVRDYFADRDSFRLVLVFGSAATGALRAHSDVDVAIAGASAFDAETLLDTQAALAEKLGRSVDLIDLARVDGLILHRIMTQGRRVKTDPSLFVRFQSKALGWKEDFLPLLQRMREARIARFTNGS